MRQAVAGAKARVAWRGLVAVVLAAAGCQGARTQAPPPQAPPPPEEERPAVSVATGDRPAGEPAAPAPARSDEPQVHPPAQPKIEQVAPPLDVKTPPADAIRTPSGLIYKKLVANAAGAGIKRNDTVMINYTRWRQRTGETVISTRSLGRPLDLNLSLAAPRFLEAIQLLKRGEKAMMWIPPAASPPGDAPPQDTDTFVYEMEIVDIHPAPEIPADLKAPPAKTRALRSGTRYVVLRGTGTAKARNFDTVTFHFTSWDSDGRQIESTEVRKQPLTKLPFHSPRALEEVLTSIPVGQRVRFWIDAEKALAGREMPEPRPKGLLTYELELLQLDKAAKEPAPVPPDVGKPPAGAKKTERGTFYKVLKAGKGGPRPGPTNAVVVHYTGWTTDGRMFDSSLIRGEPIEFPLHAVIPGWTDGVQVMSVGDRVRLWIPEELAYKGMPDRPAGMLVFDIELLEIKEAAPPPPPPP